MRKQSVGALLFAVALCLASLSSTDNKPLKATVPLSADELAIYRAVLQRYSSEMEGDLNVASSTYPLNPES